MEYKYLSLDSDITNYPWFDAVEPYKVFKHEGMRLPIHEDGRWRMSEHFQRCEHITFNVTDKYEDQSLPNCLCFVSVCTRWLQVVLCTCAQILSTISSPCNWASGSSV